MTISGGDVAPDHPEHTIESDRTLYTLVASYHDIQYAHDYVKLAKQFEHSHQIEAAFELAAVVCYARPFSANKAQGTEWRLTKANGWPGYTDKAWKKLHQYALKVRNQNYAHSDATIRAATFWPDGERNHGTVEYRRLMWADQEAMIDMTRDLRDRLAKAVEERLQSHPLLERQLTVSTPEPLKNDPHPWRKPYIDRMAEQEAEAIRRRGGRKYPGLPIGGGLG